MHVFRIIERRAAASKSPAVCHLAFWRVLVENHARFSRVASETFARTLRGFGRCVPQQGSGFISPFPPPNFKLAPLILNSLLKLPQSLRAYLPFEISGPTQSSQTILFATMELQMIRATYASQDNLERFLAGIFGEGRAEVSVSAPLHHVR